MQLSIDYAARLERLRQLIPSVLTLPSATDFQERSQALIQRSQERPEFARLFARGPCLPICLPQMAIDDYGMTLDAVFSPAMGKSFQAAHSGMKFENHLHGQMAYQMAVAPESRHAQLVKLMKRSPVVALFFPQVFRNRVKSVYRGRMAKLPSDCLLGGGVDTMAAMAMYPDVMGPIPSVGTPTYFMPALRWRSDTEALLLSTHSNGLSVYVFPDDGMLGYSFAGLLILEDTYQ